MEKWEETFRTLKNWPGTISHKKVDTTEMDNAVLTAYNWPDIDLAHNFYDMDYLPENDRTRFTISPEARKEILKRLLQLNHDLYAEEVNAGLHGKKKISSKKTKKSKQIEDAVKKGQPVPGNLF